MPYEKELKVALEAVRKVSIVTQHVFRSFKKDTKINTLTKEDKSPVTIADYSAQAIVNSCLSLEFPNDEIVGEEDAEDLKNSPELRKEILTVINELPDMRMNIEEILCMIDKGKGTGGAKGRFWALDPVDGTKGFIRGEQYAVCLALIENGDVKVAALGCPNLPVTLVREGFQEKLNQKSSSEERGLIFGAVKGQGAFYEKLNDSQHTKHFINVSSLNSDGCFCESVEKSHSDHDLSAKLAEAAGITKPPIRLDSQCKYAMIASGISEIYLRLPVKKDYQEKIWDHAAGDLIVREAGGIVTDVDGKSFDFSCGRFLSNNKGVVAANRHYHPIILSALNKL